MTSVSDQLTPGATGSATDQATAGATTSTPGAAASTTAATTVAGTTTPATTAGGGTGGTGGTGAGPYPGSGDIVWPATSVTYRAGGGGLVTAAANWTGAPTMTLTISCPNGVSLSRSGGTGLSLEVDDRGGTGTCDVTLAVPAAASGTVAYTLTIEPGP